MHSSGHTGRLSPLEDYVLVQDVTLMLSRVNKTGIFSGVLRLLVYDFFHFSFILNPFKGAELYTSIIHKYEH